MKLHKDGTLPQNGEVFVFGSNLAGRHGKGAALVARLKYGAEYGQGQGLHGQSYAIPTKDDQLQILPMNMIEGFIEEFIMFAKANRKTKFFITRVGCGLAQHRNKDIAPLFAPALPNCNYAEEWQRYLLKL